MAHPLEKALQTCSGPPGPVGGGQPCLQVGMGVRVSEGEGEGVRLLVHARMVLVLEGAN